MSETEVASILEFWFGEIRDGSDYLNERNKLWFIKDDATDQRIQKLFGDLVERALEGELDHWVKEEESTLAYILLLDQFTRNIYRGDERAFRGDRRALRASLLGVHKSLDLRLHPVQRVFFYLPLEHSEDKNCQDESIECFERLYLSMKGSEQEESFASFLDYARRHKEIVDRFSRFPHRNDILKRTSTSEELKFLEEPGSRF